MKILKPYILLLFLSTILIAQELPPNAILKDFRPYDTPRTNGRPGEVYRINENGVKYIVQDIKQIKEKISDEGDLIGRMYFTDDELLTLLNLEFDRLKVIPCEVKIVKAKREYTEQAEVDKILYKNGLVEEILVDANSKYYIVREAISTKDVTFRFSPDIVKKIKRGGNSLKKVNSTEELDFPFEIQKKFKKEKRIFYLNQELKDNPYAE